MSATPKDGGPAFPVENWRNPDTGSVRPFYGMSTRDLFAAAAVTGLLAHPKCGPVGPGHERVTGFIAREAYAVADELLAARERKEGN